MSYTAPGEVAPGRFRVELRWNDADEFGHINQAVYHELLEEARTRLMGVLPRIGQSAFVLAHVDLDYKLEIPRGHPHVEVTIEIERIGNSSFTARQRVFRADGQLAADGHSVMVAWDNARRSSRPLTEAERAGIAALQTAQQA